jgi:hypothetical protein
MLRVRLAMCPVPAHRKAKRQAYHGFVKQSSCKIIDGIKNGYTCGSTVLMVEQQHFFSHDHSISTCFLD